MNKVASALWFCAPRSGAHSHIPVRKSAERMDLKSERNFELRAHFLGSDDIS